MKLCNFRGITAVNESRNETDYRCSFPYFRIHSELAIEKTKGNFYCLWNKYIRDIRLDILVKRRLYIYKECCKMLDINIMSQRHLNLGSCC